MKAKGNLGSPFIRARFEQTGKRLDTAALDGLLEVTLGHPYATQELAYALWEATPRGRIARAPELASALAHVLRSENAHFTLVWDDASRAQRLVLQALAAEPAHSITSAEYRQRHGLPASSGVQKALDALLERELVTKLGPGSYRIGEPFLREWIVAGPS